jgi:hypothetical protein
MEGDEGGGNAGQQLKEEANARQKVINQKCCSEHEKISWKVEGEGNGRGDWNFASPSPFFQFFQFFTAIATT